MQTVKIGDVEYPWPEGCKRFFRIDTSGLPLFRIDQEERYFWIVDRDADKDELAIIASVAAMHFENLAARKRSEMSWEPETPAIREMNSRLCAEGNQAEAAARQWRTLCKEI